MLGVHFSIKRTLLWVVLICLMGLEPARSGSQTGAALAWLTKDRIDDTAWWPTKEPGDRSQYAGTETCKGCHSAIVASQSATAMAHASEQAGQATKLVSHEKDLETRLALERAGGTYSVTQGADSLSVPVVWTMGLGERGKTYILQKEGMFLESRLSYFAGPDALDITTGHSHEPPKGLDEALGTTLTPEVAKSCFGCHTTASPKATGADLLQSVPGLHCEACHGAGAKHVAAMSFSQNNGNDTFIFNPGSLDAVASVDFCGACHRTSLDVVMGNSRGQVTVRFQPYRLQKSRCWGKGDQRLTCTACHDPHAQLVRTPEYYDSRCLACHAEAGKPKKAAAPLARACPVGKKSCTTCHMKKYDLPQMHGEFTDHFIRILRTGEEFPY